MKKIFQNRLKAINWIAEFVESEAQFEVLREQLNFNYIYTSQWFIEIDTEEPMMEIVWLGDQRK